ncbi:hypothetical protein [Lamprobacter modestohalophilus]|uniref:hypothetical protein n=1 Tax=Lamprobacter modestohalophilus TaxID=1064514 RepID=UPI003D18D1D0
MTHPARHYQGERLSTLLSPLAYDAEAKLFLHDDESPASVSFARPYPASRRAPPSACWSCSTRTGPPAP